MAGYTGWGSFGQDLFQGTFEQPALRRGWDAEAAWLRQHLGREAWEEAQRSIINAHYTDPPTVQAMWAMARKMGFTGGRVLEPSMGVGNFFGLMPRDIMAHSDLTGIELDRTTAQMAKLLYPDAGVHHKGYQDSKTPDNFYDLVIGNWPFSAVSPPDRRYDRLAPTLHDYFFLKALDQTRPGGLVMGITSAGTMDKANRATRIELAKKGDLVAAFRLPSGAFENYAGTGVVTDLLIFRKREGAAPENITGLPWVNTRDLATPSGVGIRVNDYWDSHQDNVLGRLDWGHGTTSGRPGMIVTRNADFEQRLAGLPSEVPDGAFVPNQRGGEPRFITNNTADRQNSVTIGGDQQLYQVQGDRLVRLDDLVKQLQSGDQKLKASRSDQLRALVGLRRVYGAVIDAERAGAPDTEKLRKELADQFTAFRQKYGQVGQSDGLRIMRRLNDPGGDMVASLERPDGSPSRILTEPTVRAKRSIEKPSIAEAYVLARNASLHIDMDRVAALANVPRPEAEKQLLESGAVYRSPGGGFEPADVYLGGNVRRKLREAQDALDRGEDMQASVAALTSVIPPTVPYYQIEAKLGAPWVGDAIYRDFIGHMLGLAPDQLSDVHVRFSGGRWRVSFGDARMRHRTEAETNFGTPEYRFDKLVAAAMGNLAVSIKKRDEDGNQYVDADASAEVNAKIAAMREAFSDWAWQDPERKLQLEGAYNEVMNAISRPRFDGSFMDMSGMALRRGEDPFSLRKHQTDAIWRGVQQQRGLFAHEVGTGKTYTIAGIAVEGRRYGRFRKPVIFAHNANSEAVYRGAKEMYPGGNFLYVDNLDPQNIATTLHRIANEDWDAVVMPHSLIDRMALTRDTLMDLARDQITDLENEAIEAAKEDGYTITPETMDDPAEMKKLRSVTAKQLVKQREAIIANIDKQANRASREGAVPFEKLGVDAILVDEAHEFKKPPISTRMQLLGLNKNPSARSISLNFLAGYVKKQNTGKGVFLFTGTPLTNTLNEAFNMSRYIMDDQMERDGIKDWDAWFNTFAAATPDVELTAAGTYEPVTRLASFVNVDELVHQMSEFTDVVQAKDMPEFVMRATPTGKTLESRALTPEEADFLANGRTPSPEGRPYKRIISDVAEMSPEQKAILADLQERSASFKRASRKERRNIMLSGDPRNPILVETDAANAGLDARLYDPDAPEDPESKSNRVARNVLKHYAEPGAGQVIFVDRGYGPAKSSEGRADRFVLVKALVNKLVAGGIPRKEIEIVGGGVSPERKSEIAEMMNDGRLRVVIGLSNTLGVGVNMQRNLRAMHHFDAPWRPGDLEQRNGRGERQGNEWNTVLEYRYVTEGIDGRRWQVLSTKDRFIKQFINAFNDESGKRIGAIEGDAADISEEPDIMRTLAQAAGDPRIMIREKLRSDVNRLARRERQHTMGVADARQKARAMRRHIVDQKELQATEATRLGVWDAAQGRAEQAAKADGDTKRWYEASVAGQDLRTGEAIQGALDDQVTSLAQGETRVLGRINGFDIVANWSRGRQEPEYSLREPGKPGFALLMAPSMPRIVGAINSLRQRVEAAKRPSDFEQRVMRLEEAGQAEFPQAALLARRRQQVADIEQDLRENPQPAPGWLRYGAPIDSQVYVDGEPRTVRGHKVDTDFRLVTDEGDVPYRDAKDENGAPVFEVHAPPAAAAEDAATTAATPGATLYSFPGALFDPAMWRRALGAEVKTKPGTEFLRDKKGIAKASAEIRSLFAPTSLRGSQPMELAIRRHNAELAQSYDQSFETLERVRSAVDRLSPQAQVEFTDRMENGEEQPTPELQRVANALRAQLDGWATKIQGLGRGYLAQAIENYMGHIWGNYAEWAGKREGEAPTQSEMEAIARATANRRQPLPGSGAFLKQRSFPTQREGIEAGLIPVTTNPINLQLIKLREMQRFYWATTLADQMKSEHLAVWVPATAEAESDARVAGMQQLDDSIFKPRLTGGANPAGFGRLEPGSYWSSEPMARIFNNYMSRGLAGQSSIYGAVREANNALNTLQLGFSGFHAAFVSLDTLISRMALGIQQVSRGHPLRGAANIALGSAPALPYTVVRSALRGGSLRRAWLDPEKATPEMRGIVDALKAGGGRISMPSFYQSNASGAFFRTLRDFRNPASPLYQMRQMFTDAHGPIEKAVAVPARIAARLLDTIQQPLMGALVPRVKLGVFYDLAHDWMRDNPSASPQQMAEAMTRFMDSVDNRLGQLNYDNLFWDKTLKDIAFIATRSVGWNLGTARELGGAFVDAGSALKAVANGKAPALSTRMAYAMALPIVTAQVGAIMTYIATGSGPQSMVDYFYPPTGGQTPDGQPERVSIPGYMRDVVAFAHDWYQTVLNKTSPLLESIQELVHNRDYYGGIIYDPDRDRGPAQAYGDYLLNQVTPFSLRSLNRLSGEGAPAFDQMMGFWGFQPAPKSITNPERGEAWQQRQNAKAYRARLREPGRVDIFNAPP